MSASKPLKSFSSCTSGCDCDASIIISVSDASGGLSLVKTFGNRDGVWGGASVWSGSLLKSVSHRVFCFTPALLSCSARCSSEESILFPCLHGHTRARANTDQRKMEPYHRSSRGSGAAFLSLLAFPITARPGVT